MKRRTITELITKIEKLKVKKRMTANHIRTLQRRVCHQKKHPNWRDVIEKAAAKIK